LFVFNCLTIGQFWFKLALNGLGIGEGTALEFRQPPVCTNVDRSSNAQLLPSAVLLPMPC